MEELYGFIPYEKMDFIIKLKRNIIFYKSFKYNNIYKF